MTDHPTEQVTACYRHPDRRAGVTCQRCSRPICPSCMVTASVGFQCPECAKAGARASRTIDVSGRRRLTTPIVSYVLIAANLFVFVAESVSDQRVATTGGSGSFFERFALFTPFIGGNAGHGVEWYRLISGGFMHAGLIHLAFNMWALYALGPALEALIGRARFVLLYFVSLLGGGLGVVLLFSNDQGATVGASGAIFGIFGAYAVIEFSRGINPLQSSIGMTILLNLVLTVTIPGISIGGHVGGLVAGGASAAALFLGKPLAVQSEGEQAARAGAVAVLGVVCFAAAVAIAVARYGS